MLLLRSQRIGGGAVIALDPRRVVPGQGHHADLRLVEPAWGVVVGHRIAIQRVHELLHPREGEGKRLVRVVGPVQIDVHITVVKRQTLNVVRQGRLLPERAVGNADLQLLPVGQLLQRRPVHGHGDAQAAVVGVGGDGNIIAVDVVVIRPRGHGQRQRHSQRRQQSQQLFHSASSFPFSWQMCSSLALSARMAAQRGLFQISAQSSWSRSPSGSSDSQL